MIRTLIIDDNQNNREHLSGLINTHFPNIELIGEADGVDTGISAIEKLKPELVFLDIQMTDGDAFDLLEKIEKIFFKIIFVTAHEQYAIKAIKFSAMDYLLKPVVYDELSIAIQKAENQILNDLKLQLTTLQINLKSAQNKTIVLKTTEKIYLIEIVEITRCESDGNYTLFFTREGKKYMVATPLKEYEDVLIEHGFFRIHKSHIVNTSFINSLDKDGFVILKDNTSIPLSRRRKSDLIELFSKL